MEMNKLEEIIESNSIQYGKPIRPWSGREILTINETKQIALEFAKHILEEAAENVKMITEEDYDKRSGEFYYSQVVNKKSITDTLNKYL